MTIQPMLKDDWCMVLVVTTEGKPICINKINDHFIWDVDPKKCDPGCDSWIHDDDIHREIILPKRSTKQLANHALLLKKYLILIMANGYESMRKRSLTLSMRKLLISTGKKLHFHLMTLLLLRVHIQTIINHWILLKNIKSIPCFMYSTTRSDYS